MPEPTIALNEPFTTQACCVCAARGQVPELLWECELLGVWQHALPDEAGE